MSPKVGTVIGMHLPSLVEQIKARRHFYKSSPLVRDAIIKMTELRGDLMDAVLEVIMSCSCLATERSTCPLPYLPLSVKIGSNNRYHGCGYWYLFFKSI